MKIVALDPGGTTGVASGDSESEIGLWQLSSEMYHHGKLWSTLNELDPEVVVCEDFTRFMGEGVIGNAIALEYIGVARLWCEINHIYFALQKPSQKGFWSDGKLKLIGLYKTNAPHAMDALRHLLYFITFQQHDQTYLDMLPRGQESGRRQ